MKHEKQLSLLNDADYSNYRNVFFGWAKRKWPNTAEEVVEDIFHDSLIVYLKYKKQNKLTVAPTTFIISVGNNLFKKQPEFQVYDREEAEFPKELEPFSVTDLIQQGLHQLNEKCREVLVCKYFYDFSMEEIRKKTGIKTAEAARVQKHRSLKKLKEIMNNLLTMQGAGCYTADF